MPIIYLTIDCKTKALLRAFFQHVRDFDVAHSEDIAISMGVETDLSEQEVNEIIDSIRPPFAHRLTLPRKGWTTSY
jgi:hypothetical protein